jgi:hypothetical protein
MLLQPLLQPTNPTLRRSRPNIAIYQVLCGGRRGTRTPDIFLVSQKQFVEFLPAPLKAEPPRERSGPTTVRLDISVIAEDGARPELQLGMIFDTLPGPKWVTQMFVPSNAT